jgi:hypothetical protein
MKNGDLMTAKETKELIAKHGVLWTIVNGSLQEENVTADDIEDTDLFEVVINYGNGVQLHLVNSKMRVVITLEELKGRCENMEWVA